MPPRTWILLLLVLAAGCVGGGDGDAFDAPLPAEGDVVEYAVRGTYVDLVRWEPEVQPGLRTLRVSVLDGGSRFDAGLRPHETLEIRTEADAGSGLQHLDSRYVSRTTNAVVQAFTPFNATERVVSFEEFGAPWLFGASALQGRAPPVDFAIPPTAGQPSALVLQYRARAEGAAWNVTVAGPVEANYEFRKGSPYPETFRITIRDGAAGYVANGFRPGATFEGRKVSETRGADPPARAPTAADLPGGVAGLSPWDGRAPPERGPTLVFPLREALAAAERQDLPLRSFLDAASEARLYRATYFLGDAPLPGAPREPTWNLGYVSADERYHEVKVARVAGLEAHRTYDSRAVDPPRGEHGWIDAEDLPDELLPLDAAVAAFTAQFDPTYEIFVRSFTGDARTPAGYYYLIDGGFEVAGGRYTTTWSAGTGRLESAVGPIGPR